MSQKTEARAQRVKQTAAENHFERVELSPNEQTFCPQNNENGWNFRVAMDR